MACGRVNGKQNLDYIYLKVTGFQFLPEVQKHESVG